MDPIITKLQDGTKQLSLNLSTAQLQQIEGYLAALQKWNRVFNLTAIRDVDAMLSHHVFDSLVMVPFFERGESFIDIGTGAGLPGLILAIALPQKQFTLLDTNSKKTSFIKQTAHQLGLQNVTVVTARVEDFQSQALFDAVVSRAFSSLADFVTLGERFLKPTGVLVAMKGPRVREELAVFTRAHRLETLTVPFLDETRYVVVVPKQS